MIHDLPHSDREPRENSGDENTHFFYEPALKLSRKAGVSRSLSRYFIDSQSPCADPLNEGRAVGPSQNSPFPAWEKSRRERASIGTFLFDPEKKL